MLGRYKESPHRQGSNNQKRIVNIRDSPFYYASFHVFASLNSMCYAKKMGLTALTKRSLLQSADLHRVAD
jgi:2-phospho-L-lactate guanylyltransferase (CobY/MobA/RfbA family)